MGRAKIKKKSTFIDMTAMSDVTVLLLTFFMLPSTSAASDVYKRQGRSERESVYEFGQAVRLT